MNRLSGSIPSELGLLVGLLPDQQKPYEGIRLHLNDLTGAVPDEICELRNETPFYFRIDCVQVRCDCCDDFCLWEGVTECGRGFSTLRVAVTTDNYPAETTWEVVDENSGGTLVQGGGYTDGVDSRKTFVTNACVESDSCFKFTIYDLYADGLWDGFHLGEYMVLLDGVEIASGQGDFGASDSIRFGNTCRTPAPTTSSSPTTTQSPSPSPTATQSPSAPIQCENGTSPFRVLLTTDDLPHFISWDVIDINSGTTILQGGGYDIDADSFATFVYEACVSPDESCLVFTINNLAVWFDGNYLLYLDGEEIASGGGGYTYYSESYQFGNCAPTLAPTRNFIECESGFAPVRVELNTDDSPFQTSWEVVGKDSGTTLMESDPYVEGIHSFRTIVDEACVPSDSCFVFTIKDWGNNGVCCFFGEGEYTLFFDGKEIASGGEFGSQERVQFGNDNCE